MSFQLSMGSIKQYESHSAAERAILCFFPAGYTYEVCQVRFRAIPHATFWTVKAYHKSGAFAGYCYDPQSEI